MTRTAATLLAICAACSWSDSPTIAMPPARDMGEGPYPTLVLENVCIIDGRGSPVSGPSDIIVSSNRISHIGKHLTGLAYPADVRVIDLTDHYVLPGFIDAHAHLGLGMYPTEYVLDLMLLHGVTSIREVSPEGFLDSLVALRAASRSNSIAAPRLFLWPVLIDDDVPALLARGIDGLKIMSYRSSKLDPLFKSLAGTDVRVACHDAGDLNALQLLQRGVKSIEHFFGLPEAFLGQETTYVQDWANPALTNCDRFRKWGTLWERTLSVGETQRKKVIAELIQRGAFLVPTFSVYSAFRDVSSQKNAEWQPEYTSKDLWSFFEPNAQNSWGFLDRWTTEDEVQWRRNIAIWMKFIRDFSAGGGRVAAGSDAGWMYDVYGFGYIHELQLLEECGLTPLEVIRSATRNGAELLNAEADLGSVEVGKLADLNVCRLNPLSDLKSLYATGIRAFDAQGDLREIHGLQYVIKDGIIYATDELRRRVKQMVANSR